MNKALIVIDAQQDFTYGALKNEEAIKALSVMKEVVEYAAENFDKKIIYTQDTHGADYLETQEGKNLPIPHCLWLTKGWHICPEVYNERSETLKKSTFGYGSWNMKNLENVDEIWLCGFCTDICISANFQLLKATYPEVPIVVIEDACAGVAPELHEAALKVMESCQAKIMKWNDLKKETEIDYLSL